MAAVRWAGGGQVGMAMPRRVEGWGRRLACGLLVCACAAVTLCHGVLASAEDEPVEAAVETAKAESCETDAARRSLSGWVVLQWTVLMALARCVGQPCAGAGWLAGALPPSCGSCLL